MAEKYCTNCGTKVTGFRYCPNCSMAVDDQPQSAAAIEVERSSRRNQSKRERAIASGLVAMVLFGAVAFITWNYHYLGCEDINGNVYTPLARGGCPAVGYINGVSVGVLFPVDVYPYRLFGIILGLLSLAMLVYASVGGKEK